MYIKNIPSISKTDGILNFSFVQRVSKALMFEEVGQQTKIRGRMQQARQRLANMNFTLKVGLVDKNRFSNPTCNASATNFQLVC